MSPNLYILFVINNCDSKKDVNCKNLDEVFSQFEEVAFILGLLISFALIPVFYK